MERTFIMIKPDGVRRRLVGEVVRRLENKGFDLLAIKMLTLTGDMAAAHYREHKDKEFYPELIEHITSGPVVAMVWQGSQAIGIGRLLVGHRDPLRALPGTIRGDFACVSTENLVHAADSPTAAERELKLFFPNLGAMNSGQ